MFHVKRFDSTALTHGAVTGDASWKTICWFEQQRQTRMREHRDKKCNNWLVTGIYSPRDQSFVATRGRSAFSWKNIRFTADRLNRIPG